MSDSVEVWLDKGVLGVEQRIGLLSTDGRQIRFSYEPAWLKDSNAFPIDPDLSLDTAPFYPKASTGNFGIFLDSSPDRWGQTLMRRRETSNAKKEGRKARILTEWDYLLGVQDFTRQGALRFKRAGTEIFLADDLKAAPPVTTLRTLEQVAYQLSDPQPANDNQIDEWLKVLVAPGSSLGGARPKANFTDTDGSAWIAKFPAKDDTRDIGKWEFLAHQLALQAGLNVPAARLLSLTTRYSTFCVKRFDRLGTDRQFYASAMSLLRKESAEGTSYIELAEFIQRTGPNRAVIEADLLELYRRIAFYIAVGNRDDHLRNHGFLLQGQSWHLAPAFDINPNIDKAHHVCLIDEASDEPSFEALLDTHPYYGLKVNQAKEVIDRIRKAVGNWRALAEKQGLSRQDCEEMAAAFSD